MNVYEDCRCIGTIAKYVCVHLHLIIDLQYTHTSKLRYLSLELFGDLVPFLFGTFEFYSSVFLYLFALWMRIYVHFLAQYLYLLV
ncbi:hypothetical protein EON63_13480 [archaeon]|nr:MAG: hypothetical protein EON63_13480 [archaeon]